MTETKTSDSSDLKCGWEGCGKSFETEYALKIHKGKAHEYNTKIETKCKYCSDMFTVRKNREDTVGFCSQDCHNKYRSEKNEDVECYEDGCDRTFDRESSMKCHHTKIHKSDNNEAKCEECDNIFEVRPSEDNKRFCSVNCKNDNQDQKITHNCLECGDSFSRPPSYGHVDFCSNECRNEFHRETNICKNCNSSYQVIKSKAERSEYCSNECMYEHATGTDHWNWSRVNVSCDYCGGTYSVEQAKSDNSRFCSRECQGNWRSENIVGENHPSWKKFDELICDSCGGEYEVKPSLSERSRFCSQECFGDWFTGRFSGEDNANWKEGNTPYGAGWNERKKELIRTRDNRHCQRCGVSTEELDRSLPVHHVIPAREWDSPRKRNKEENLITLCTMCHPKVENGVYECPPVPGVPGLPAP